MIGYSSVNQSMLLNKLEKRSYTPPYLQASVFGTQMKLKAQQRSFPIEHLKNGMNKLLFLVEISVHSYKKKTGNYELTN